MAMFEPLMEAFMVRTQALLLTTPEASLWGAVIGTAGLAVGGIGRWILGRRSAEERNAKFWKDQVEPLTGRVLSLEGELARVKDSVSVEAKSNANRLQQVQIAHAETLRAVQEKADADRKADWATASAHLRETVSQFNLELEDRDTEIATLRAENKRLLAAQSSVVRQASPKGPVC